MKFLYTLTLPATRWQTAWNIQFRIVLVFFTLVASIARAQTNTAFSGFTQSFNPAGSNILFTTTNTNDFFTAGNAIGLATIDGSPLSVFAWYGPLLYSGPATNLYLPVGRTYFVEAPGTATSLPCSRADWSSLTNVGMGQQQLAGLRCAGHRQLFETRLGAGCVRVGRDPGGWLQ